MMNQQQEVDTDLQLAVAQVMLAVEQETDGFAFETPVGIVTIPIDSELGMALFRVQEVMNSVKEDEE